MGTTATAIRSGEGVQLCWVLAIEGYDRLLTDWKNLGAITTAYVGTDWSLALPGLVVRGSIRQACEPWADTIEPPMLTFAVQPDDDDTFGIAVWKTKPDFRTRLTAIFEPLADGSGTLAVKDVTGAPADGTIYYGGRAAKYSAKGAGSFTITSANHYAPFAGDGSNKYVPPHAISKGEFLDTKSQPYVQTLPRTWVGKKVALYLHRVVGGVVDTPAQAQLEFAGKVTRVYEDQHGFTALECVDLRADIRDCVLHRRQWRGFIKEGIRLVAGQKLTAIEEVSGSPVSANTFEVLASGASGASQINEGYYDIYAFVAKLDKWLAANAGTFSSDWSCSIRPLSEGGLRTVFTGSRSSAAAQRFILKSTSAFILDFLGFDVGAGTHGGYWSAEGPKSESTATYQMVSPRPPYRVRAIQTQLYGGAVYDHRSIAHTIELDGHEGAFWDHEEFLPPQLAEEADGGTWSLFKIGKSYVWGQYVDDTELTHVGLASSIAAASQNSGLPVDDGLTVEQSGENLEIRQVVCLSGSFSEIIPRLFASLAGDGTNHATYDSFPMGAGIPWSLLGNAFLASVRSLEQANRTGGMLLLLDRPTKLVDVLLPELLLRFAWVIFKDGVYQLVSPPTPNALETDFTLDETNKAGQELDLRASSEVTQEWMRNVVKVDYNRTIDGTYKKHLIVYDPTSIADYGESQAVTIRAANAFGDEAGTGTSVEDLAVNLISKVLPFFARPMKVVRRSLSPDEFHRTPGDTVTVSDAFVRDPTTGRRGMGNRAGIVLAVSHSWGEAGGELSGEVDIMFSDEDRTYPMAPCAEVDTDFNGTIDGLSFTDGYAAAGPALKLKDHAHSRSSDATDITHLAEDDEIRILELDPADPTSIDAWDRVIDLVDVADGYILLTASLSSPSWGGATKLYRVTSRLYADVTEDQQLHAFLADDSDGLIQNEAEPNQFGEFSQGTYSPTAATMLPRLIPTEADDEGRPFHPGLLGDLAIALNHLVNYGCARALPVVMGANAIVTNTSSSYKLYLVWPFFIAGQFQGGTTRRLVVAPELSTTSGTVSCRVTVSKTPPKGDSLTGVSWEGTKYQREFSTTSTTRTVLTPQTLNALVGAAGGLVYISIELKNSGGTGSFYGLAEQELGPLQSTV